MNDTTPEIESRFASMLAAKSPADRLRMAASMSEAGRMLLQAGILARNRGIDEPRLRGQLLVQLYGDELTREELDRIAAGITGLVIPK